MRQHTTERQHTMKTSTSELTSSPNRLAAVIFGAVFLLVGIFGLFVAGDHIVSTEGGNILGFEVNHLHNVVHIVIGAVLLSGGLKSIPMAKKANMTVGIVYLVVGILGLFIINTAYNFLALNAADNWLHFITAGILLAVAYGTERGTVHNTVGTHHAV